MKQIDLNLERPEIFRKMEELVRDAFWDKYSPGCCEHLVVHNLRTSENAIKDLCFIANFNNELVGGIWYAKASIRHNGNAETPVLTMGPIAVRPDMQGMGIGSKLIRHTMQLAENRACAIIIYGNPSYYSQFGFKPGSDFGITDATGTFCPALLVYPMGNVPSGEFHEGAIYQITPSDVNAFESTFPPRQKHLNSKQLFFSFPCPPPKNKNLKPSWELRNQACTVLKASGIIEAFEAIDACIKCPDSFNYNTIMEDRSINLDVYTKTLDASKSLNEIYALKSQSMIHSIAHTIKSNSNKRYIEWNIKIFDNEQNLWSVNIIQHLVDTERT